MVPEKLLESASRIKPPTYAMADHLLSLTKEVRTGFVYKVTNLVVNIQCRSSK